MPSFIIQKYLSTKSFSSSLSFIDRLFLLCCSLCGTFMIFSFLPCFFILLLIDKSDKDVNKSESNLQRKLEN